MKIRSLLAGLCLLVLVVMVFRVFCSVLELAGTMDTIGDGKIVEGDMVAYANEDYETTPGPCPYGGTCTPVLRDENVSYIHVTGSLDPYLSWASVGWCLPCTCPEYDVQNVVGVAVVQVQYTPTPLPAGSPTPLPEYYHIFKHSEDRDYWREPGDPGVLCQPFALATAIREATQLIPKTVTGTTAITGRTAYLSGNPDGCPVYRSDRQTPCAKGYVYIFDVDYKMTPNEEGGLDLTYTISPEPSFGSTQPCQTPYVHDVTIDVHDSGGNYAYSSTTVTLGGWTDTWEWDGHFTLGNVDWNQCDTLTIQFTGYVAGFTAELYGNEPPDCTGCGQRDASFWKEMCYPCPCGSCNTYEIHILSADIVADQIHVVMGPYGTGTMRLQLENPSAVPTVVPHIIRQVTRSCGGYLESFDIPNLAEGEYTQIRATWTVGGNPPVEDTYPYHIRVLGNYRQTCYTLPQEAQCEGPNQNFTFVPGVCAAYDHCNEVSVPGRQEWLSVMAVQGSGIGMSGNIYTKEWVCNNVDKRRVRDGPCSHCGTVLATDHSVAIYHRQIELPHNHRYLSCGDRVFIDGIGVRIVDDTGEGVEEYQLDHYFGPWSCNTCADYGYRMTVKLFD